MHLLCMLEFYIHLVFSSAFGLFVYVVPKQITIAGFGLILKCNA